MLKAIVDNYIGPFIVDILLPAVLIALSLLLVIGLVAVAIDLIGWIRKRCKAT